MRVSTADWVAVGRVNVGLDKPTFNHPRGSALVVTQREIDSHSVGGDMGLDGGNFESHDAEADVFGLLAGRDAWCSASQTV